MKRKILKFPVVLALIISLIIANLTVIQRNLISTTANIKNMNSENVEVETERIYR